MPRWLIFTAFIVVATLIVGSVHFYLYRRLVISTALTGHWAFALRALLAALAAGIPLSFGAARLLDHQLARYLVFPVYVWLGVMLMLFFALLGTEVVRAGIWLVGRIMGDGGAMADPARRVFLSRIMAGGATGTVLAAAGVGVARGLGVLAVKKVEVVLPHLPRQLDGFTIAQLTDLHLGPMRGRDWLARVVQKTNALKPDLVAITGDLVDGTVTQLTSVVEPLKELKANQGVFFTTGNHEYFADLHGWMAHLPKLGLRILHNEHVTVGQPGAGASFDLAGVDDHGGRRFAPGHGVDVGKALKGRAPGRAVVLLAHQPRVAEEASRHQVGLVLSGHTHGGQIWPWRYLVYLQQPYISGLHDHHGTQIYVSEGTGFWGPPMRVGTTAEIALVTLRSPGKA